MINTVKEATMEFFLCHNPVCCSVFTRGDLEQGTIPEHNVSNDLNQVHCLGKGQEGVPANAKMVEERIKRQLT